MEDPIPLARVLGSRNQPSANRRIKFPYTKGSSAGKESACNAGEPSWIPGSGGSTGEAIGYPPQYSWGFLVDGSAGKESAGNAGDLGSIPGLGRSSGEVNKCLPTSVDFLENLMDRGACQATVHGVAKTRRQLSNFHFQ